jgi:hypothetical protein
MFMKSVICILLCIVFSHYSNAQGESQEKNPNGSGVGSYIGFGGGLNYGGLGMNAVIYPGKNVGLFAALGYNFAGVGVNAGIKCRPNPQEVSPTPFLLVMYGYNLAYHIKNATIYDKTFHGLTFGAGIDINLRKGDSHPHLDLGILLPVRSSAAINYEDELKSKGVYLENNISALGIFIGIMF